MTHTIKRLASFLLRLCVLWAVDAIALILTAVILPGVNFQSANELPAWLWAVAAAFLLGIINLLIRPLVLLIARPLGPLLLFVVGFLVNGLMLIATSALLAGFQVSGLLTAVIAGIVFSGINLVLTSALDVDEEGSYYQNRIERMAASQPSKTADEPGVGLVMLEIDGLSYHHLQKALADGRLPTLKKMMDEEGYTASLVDCGIPSQTSACQAGIMFGDNDDIPAFRWYDKDKQKLYVSGSDAPEINARYAKGQGLMRGGSSIGNMLNGDAEKSLLTLAVMRTADPEQKRRRAEDVRLLMLSPYFLMHTVALFLANVVRELWEGWRQVRHDVQPRQNRVKHFYPFIRAATCVFVRDLAANLTILDILRGAPSIYMTWPGYDEVAHHSGPWTRDAFNELGRFDRTIERVRRVIEEKAPRPYDLIVLSDHGQSFGPTFKQRYGISLKEFIEQKLPQGTTVSQSMGGDTGIGPLSAVGTELQNVTEQGAGSGVSKAVAKQGQKLIEQGVKEGEGTEAAPAQVTAYGSGNLAQVYFDLYPRKITVSELNAVYPGMVDALVQHEGIGLVCGYNDDVVPIALGKEGIRNLHTGKITGKDPLRLYAPSEGYGAAAVEKRNWQVRRVMDFPHAGDLMVLSTVYPDGTVAALEELIGNHGGIGGEQTDAFIFHPPEMEVPETRNSIDVFHILNNRRGGPPREKSATQPTAEAETAAWAPRNLLAGIGQVRTWLGRAIRALILDRSAYREVAGDPLMTGPAVLIALLTLTLAVLTRPGGYDVARLLISFIAWPISVLALFGAGRLLTRTGVFTRTLRSVGFAQSVYFLQVLALIKPLASAISAMTIVMGFLAIWMAAATAHETRGWRTVLLPLVAYAVLIIGFAVVAVLLAGAALTIGSVLQTLGIQLQ